MKKKFVPRANNEIIESGRNISDFQSKNHYRSWRHDHGLKEKVNSELQIGFVTGVALYWIHCNAVTVYVTVACDIFSLIISLSMYHSFICLFSLILVASNWKVCSRSLPAEQLTKCLDAAVTDVVTSLAGGKDYPFFFIKKLEN